MKFQPGDWVLVTRQGKSINEGNWANVWVDSKMNCSIGKVCQVIEDNGEASGVSLEDRKYGGCNLNYPHDVLKKVPERNISPFRRIVLD